MNPWHWLLNTIESGLAFLHQAFEPVFGVHAWGWAIIGLTLVIRVLLLPLAVKQTRSMKAMQQLNPEMQKIRKKYKTDREMMRKNPEKYKAQRQKMNEEVMALYKEHNVNPAASCLPLVLQAPIFFALFRVLNDSTLELDGEVISQAPFYVIDQIGGAANSEIAGWFLVVGMIVTMFVSQKQMMARTHTQMEGIQAQQQKLMLYGMPVFLGFVAYRLPIGVLLYWVTTNLWQMGQQTVIFREAKAGAEEDAKGAKGPKGAKGAKGSSAVDGPPKPGSKKPGDEPGKKKKQKSTEDQDGSGRGRGERKPADRPTQERDQKKRPPTSGGAGNGRSDNGGRPRKPADPDHLPRRKRR